ncbi:MAG: hypothetical protein ACFFCS_03325 [Candidatus Hodarchaeota archaeon]
MVTSILGICFFITLAGSAFTLRGIWGHNLGGGVMGILVGLGLGVLLGLHILLSIELMFWLGVTWAISGFVGWASHTTVQRFFRGYLIYAMLPNLVIGFMLYSDNPLAFILLVLLGSIGMGAGFGMSYKLLLYLRGKLEENHEKKSPMEKINWGTEPVKEGEISHVYVFRFDTWKVAFEIVSGALYAITSIIIYAWFPITIGSSASPSELDWYHVLMLLACCILVPFGLASEVIREKRSIKGFKLPDAQTPLDARKGKFAHLIVAIFTVCWGILLFAFLKYFMKPLVLFLVLYWAINGMGRFYNPLDSKLFQTDCMIDIALGVIITITGVFV